MSFKSRGKRLAITNSDSVGAVLNDRVISWAAKRWKDLKVLMLDLVLSADSQTEQPYESKG
jgi:hypothetical protein